MATAINKSILDAARNEAAEKLSFAKDSHRRASDRCAKCEQVILAGPEVARMCDILAAKDAAAALVRAIDRLFAATEVYTECDGAASLA